MDQRLLLLLLLLLLFVGGDAAIFPKRSRCKEGAGCRVWGQTDVGVPVEDVGGRRLCQDDVGVCVEARGEVRENQVAMCRDMHVQGEGGEVVGQTQEEVGGEGGIDVGCRGESKMGGGAGISVTAKCATREEEEGEEEVEGEEVEEEEVEEEEKEERGEEEEVEEEREEEEEEWGADFLTLPSTKKMKVECATPDSKIQMAIVPTPTTLLLF